MAVVRGGIQFYALQGSQRAPIFRVGTGQVSGVLPYSRLREAKNQGLATGQTLLYLLHRDQFPALEQASPELVQRLVAIMNDRSRDQVRSQERDDKLRARHFRGRRQPLRGHGPRSLRCGRGQHGHQICAPVFGRVTPSA